MIKTTAYPRISIAGNPSDGYWGKCLSATFFNYKAKSIITPVPSSDKFEFQRQNEKYLAIKKQEFKRFLIEHLSSQYTHKKSEPHKLQLAVVKTFFDFCDLNGIKYKPKPFRLYSESDIPFLLGFAGSTALSISILRALNKFYRTKICKEDMENMALHAETHELGRIAGPQDPTAINQESGVYMDFSKQAYLRNADAKNTSSLEQAVIHVDYSSSEAYLSNWPIHSNGKTRYTTSPLIKKLNLQDFPFFIITKKPGSDSSAELSPRTQDYRRGNKTTIRLMKKLAKLAKLAKRAVENKDIEILGEIINQGFEISVQLDQEVLNPRDIEFVRQVIREGAYAKFPGSSGSVFGIYPTKKVFRRLKRKFEAEGYKVERLKMIPHQAY